MGVLRRRAIFDCHKWDPQVGDANVIARYPLIIRRDAWNDVVPLAEALARETLAAEAELLMRPDLHSRLAFPREVRRALAAASSIGATVGVARIVRFDFHYTADGWRISEANSDVPGGLNEASEFAHFSFYGHIVVGRLRLAVESLGRIAGHAHVVHGQWICRTEKYINAMQLRRHPEDGYVFGANAFVTFNIECSHGGVG